MSGLPQYGQVRVTTLMCLHCESSDADLLGEALETVKVIRHDEDLSFSRRCADEAGARFVATALKRDQLNAGWIESIA
jgi:hypothetical protein